MKLTGQMIGEGMAERDKKKDEKMTRKERENEVKSQKRRIMKRQKLITTNKN